MTATATRTDQDHKLERIVGQGVEAYLYRGQLLIMDTSRSAGHEVVSGSPEIVYTDGAREMVIGHGTYCRTVEELRTKAMELIDAKLARASDVYVDEELKLKAAFLNGQTFEVTEPKPSTIKVGDWTYEYRGYRIEASKPDPVWHRSRATCIIVTPTDERIAVECDMFQLREDAQVTKAVRLIDKRLA